MALSRKVLLVLLLAFACTIQLAVSETASQSEEGATEAQAPASETASGNKRIRLKQSGLLPAFLWPVRKTRQPNIFLMFFDLYEPMMPQQIKDMVNQQIRPPTEQMSEQILSSVPAAKQFYEQMYSFMQMFAQFGPQNFLGGGGSGGGGSGTGTGRGNGLTDMVGGLMGRR